jgi:hypothetical protein
MKVHDIKENILELNSEELCLLGNHIDSSSMLDYLHGNASHEDIEVKYILEVKFINFSKYGKMYYIKYI